MIIKKIPLKSIIVEHNVRNALKDKDLTKDIEQRGLQEPLVVEGPNIEGNYFLIEGYRRYVSLINLEYTEVECYIKKLTEKSDRLIISLGGDLHTKRKNGYELERKIKMLLDNDKDNTDIDTKIDKIAKQLNVQKYIIKRYTDSLDVDESIKKQAEEAKVGRDGLTRISKMKNITENIKSDLIKRYLKSQIYGYHVNSIEYIVNSKLFGKLSEISQIKCINEAISQTKFDQEKADIIVNNYFLKEEYDNDACQSIYDEILKELDKVTLYCSENLIKSLGRDQLMQLKSSVELLHNSLKAANEPKIIPLQNVKITSITK